MKRLGIKWFFLTLRLLLLNLWFAVYRGEIVFSDIILKHFCDGFPHVQDANSLMIFVELENSK